MVGGRVLVSQGRRKAKSKSVPRSANPFASPKSRIAFLCVLLAVATIALYSPVTGHAFLTFDDHDYVTSNLHIH